MAFKYIPESWRDDMRTNVAHKQDFYINPRGRVFPALTSAGVSYIKNDVACNMRGTYRMQCGASTSLTYLYTLPQRFIIEGWFKPEFAYNVGSHQMIFTFGDNPLYAVGGGALYYDFNSDIIGFLTWVGATSNFIYTTQFTTTLGLDTWIYFRAFFDNIGKLKGFYCTANGVVIADAQNTPGAGTFTPSNIVSFFPTVAAESSYWIIHELDETLTTGQYKTYQADRQIIFEFNGTALGRERIRIPRVIEDDDLRGVTDYTITKTGSGKANTATLDLLNKTGSFSDDQYDAFDPFQGYYNGPQKYLQNRVGVEITSTSPSATRYGITDPTFSKTKIVATDIEFGTANKYGFYYSAATHDEALSIVGGTLKIASPIAVNIFRLTVDARSLARKILINPASTCTLIFNNDGTSYPIVVTGGTWNEIYITFDGTGAAATDIENFPIGDSYILYDYIGTGSTLSSPIEEPVFIGRTTPGAFSRNSPSPFEGGVSVNAEDGISELGETKLPASHAYNNDVAAYTLSQTADESLSLVHLLTRIVTKHEIRNYMLNSSFENATIVNSWSASGLTFTRDGTYPLFGTYAGKAVCASAGQYFTQTVAFTGIDKIDVGDSFNASFYIRQGIASAVSIRVDELDSSSTVLHTGTPAVSSASTNIYERLDASRTVINSACAKLRVIVYSNAAVTFYADSGMLVRGLDPIDYSLLNTADGTSGEGSADSAATYLYDTKAIDTDVTSLSHPFAIVPKGETSWEHIKDIGDALIPRYIGETCDGVFQFKFYYNGGDPSTIGAIEDVASIQTSLDSNNENSIRVEGYLIDKTETNTPIIALGLRGATLNSGAAMLHPIANGAYLTINGSSDIEVMYEVKE